MMLNTTAGVWLNALLQPLARFTQAIDARHTQPTAAGTFSDAAETWPPAQHRDVPGRAA